MATLMVGYDLNTPGKDYEKLIEYMKSFGTWWHHLDSTWLVVAEMTPVQLRASWASSATASARGAKEGGRQRRGARGRRVRRPGGLVGVRGQGLEVA